MLEQIPYKLFAEWMKYYELEPFGQLRDNLHAGIISASIWQSNMEPGSRHRVTAADFILDAEEKESLEPQEIFVMLKAHLVRGEPDADR